MERFICRMFRGGMLSTNVFGELGFSDGRFSKESNGHDDAAGWAHFLRMWDKGEIAH